jgi:two-component system, OmpR family, sensor histidine kinase ChvG
MRRILVINILPLALFVASLLYLDNFRQGLIEAETGALFREATIIAGALGESVAEGVEGAADSIDKEEAIVLMRRLTLGTSSRARLFDVEGNLIADSRELRSAGGDVQAEELPPPGHLHRLWDTAVRLAMAPLPRLRELPRYHERAQQRARDYNEVMKALEGREASALRDAGRDGDILSVAVPVQRFKRVQGGLMLSTSLNRAYAQLREVRSSILILFSFSLSLTITLSVYLALTIAQPMRKLAAAADQVRQGTGRSEAIPDYTSHGDEVGELSGALIDMTKALHARMDATERFAADVAHEIKNPLSSMRSAIEVADRVQDPEQRQRMMRLALEDARRLDRLVTDISNASRLDAEMRRSATGGVDVADLLATLVEVQGTNPGGAPPRIALDAPGPLVVRGLETPLGQVFRNLLENALSFSPPEGTVRIRARRDGSAIEVAVEDEGPGLPPETLDAVFERFYSERPAGEAFGTHSGLGLSIARQIVEAHKGRIWAENLGPDADKPHGARFVVRLPATPVKEAR